MSQDLMQKQFEELQQKHQQLNAQAIKINTQIEHAQENLKSLKETALKKYGTDDLNELKTMARDLAQQNKQQMENFSDNVFSLEKEVLHKQQLIKKLSISNNT